MGVMTEEISGTTYSFNMPKGKLDEYQTLQWETFLSLNKNKLEKDEFKMICKIHADVFAHPYHEPCTCSPKRIKNWIAQINKVYDNR